MGAAARLARRLGPTLALVAACESGPELEFVAWPELGPEIQTAVVKLETADRLVSLTVYPARELPRLTLATTESVLLLGYHEPPEAFGPGPLDPTAPRLDCFLSFPKRVERVPPAGTGFSPSHLRPDERELLNGGRRCLACLDFEIERLDIPGLDRGPLLRLPSGAAVMRRVGSPAETPHFIRIDRDGRYEPITGCEGRRYVSAAAEDPSHWWLGGADGRLERLAFDEGARTCAVTLSTRTPSLAERPVDSLESITVAQAAGAVEVLTASRNGRLDRFDPAEGWTPLAQFTPAETLTSRELTVIHLNHREAVLSAGDDRLLFWRGGGEAVERRAQLAAPLDPFRPAWITTLAPAPTGFWLGDSDGRVARWVDGGRPAYLDLPTELADVGVIRARGRGLVALTEGGRVLQVDDGGGPCPNVPVILGGFRAVPRYAFVEADGSMFVADAISAGSERFPAWLWPR